MAPACRPPVRVQDWLLGNKRIRDLVRIPGLFLSGKSSFKNSFRIRTVWSPRGHPRKLKSKDFWSESA